MTLDMCQEMNRNDCSNKLTRSPAVTCVLGASGTGVEVGGRDPLAITIPLRLRVSFIPDETQYRFLLS